MTFGPWSPGLADDVERRCQFRSLAALTAIFFGSQHILVGELRDAERGDVYASQRAFDLLNCLPSRSRRKMLSVFSAITWPRRPSPSIQPRKPYRDDIDEREPVGRFCDVPSEVAP